MKEQVIDFSIYNAVYKTIKIVNFNGRINQCFAFFIRIQMCNGILTVFIDFFLVILNQVFFVLTGAGGIDQITCVLAGRTARWVRNEEDTSAVLVVRYSIGIGNLCPLLYAFPDHR